LFVALLLALFAVVSHAEEPAGETIVSTEICTGLWIVDLVWAPEGREPQDLVAVFDTGAGSAFIDPDAIERISGKRIKEGKRAKLEDMSVAGRSFHTFRPEVKDLDHISRALGRQLDVFLPFQTFDSFLLILDYPAEEMRIRRGELPEPDGERVFNAKGKDKRPWLEVQVGRIERELLIDSGSTGNISVKDHRKLEWVSDPIPLRLFQGMYDVELTRMGRLDGVAVVGPLDFDQPLVTLTDDTELMGAQVLRHFVWTFDQGNRRVMMEPAADGPVVMPAYEGTGVVFLPRAEYFEIAHVVEGSPAEQAGLKKGDRVTHANGVPVDERPCRTIDPAPDESTTLTVNRDGLPFEVTLLHAVLVP
jgi:hypothetical protein